MPAKVVPRRRVRVKLFVRREKLGIGVWREGLQAKVFCKDLGEWFIDSLC
jgi:hypothetical protein